MLKLTLTDAEGIPPCPALEGPEVDHWRDAMGSVIAHAIKAGESHWVVVPGTATFCFGHGSSEALGVPHPGVAVEYVHEVFRRTVLSPALQALGLEALHASGVRTGHGVVALCGASGAGKSTLAFALGQRGYPIWADDTMVLEPKEGRVLAVPTPFKLRLRPPVATFFGLTATPACGQDEPSREPVPLAGVLLLERVSASTSERALELLRLSASDAFVRALRHVNCFSFRDSVQKRRLLDNYLALVASVPVFTLRFASDLARLPEVVDALAAAIDRAFAPPP